MRLHSNKYRRQQGLLLETPKKHKYIKTIIDCFPAMR